MLITAKCIDHYTRLRVENAELGENEQKSIDPRLEAVVNRMFQRCFDDKQYKQVFSSKDLTMSRAFKSITVNIYKAYYYLQHLFSA